jgi:hypothetical protein
MNTDSELIERLREFGEHLSPVSEYYGSGIADILAAADRLEALSRALAEAERRLDLSNGHYEAWLDQIAMLVGMGSSSVPLPALVEQKIAALRVATEAQAKLSAFVRYVLAEGPWAGHGIDGGDTQDAAERFGLISPAPYDPAKHGYHVDFSDGDRWFKFTPLVLPLSSIGATTPGGEAMSTDNVLTERLLAAARIEALSLALAEAEKQRDEAEARLRVVVEALRPFALAASGIPADKKDKDITRVAMDEILSKEEIDRFREIGRPVRSPHAELLVSLDGLRARDFRRARAALSSIGEV